MNSRRLFLAAISLAASTVAASPVRDASYNYYDDFIVDVVTVSPKPINYGLFIGVKDSVTTDSGGTVTSRQDRTASKLADAFSQIGGQSFLLTKDLTNGESVSKAEVEGVLASIKARMRSNDTLTLYAGSHGSSYDMGSFSVSDDGRGTEYLQIGQPSPVGLPNWLSDDALTDLLIPFDAYQKMILLDACHSGGFWATGDVLEAFNEDLASLSKITLISSASEANVSYGLRTDGDSFFGNALIDALSKNSRGQIKADANRDGTLSTEELWEYINRYNWAPFFDAQMFEMGFGDVLPFDETLMQFQREASSDFDERYAVGTSQSVPEPGSLALLLGILPALILSRRHLGITRKF